MPLRRENVKTTGKVLQFLVTLQGITPPVWRRIQIGPRCSFWDLHVAVQDAMGWTDTHLHQFSVPNPHTGATDEIGIPDEEGLSGESPCLSGWEVPVARYFPEKGAAADYEYDFGDGWEHTIVLEDVVDRGPGGRYPRCVAGQRACPPEDCGGVHGYERLLRVLADPRDSEHDAMREWVGPGYDPEKFSPNDVRFDSPRARLKLMMEDG